MGDSVLMTLSQDDLRLASLARQFPASPPSDPAALLAMTGPIQSQTARSTFLGLAARSPGITHAGVSAAFERAELLRGSTVRGTVHSVVPEHQRVLDGVTRTAMRTFWRRTLPMRSLTLEEVWAALEDFARVQWRSSEELTDRLRALLLAADEQQAARSLESQAGRHLAVGHGGLVRRPLRGGWEGQGRAGYRAAEPLTGLARLTGEEAVQRAVLLHVRRHGPSNRRDISWWSGLGLRAVDAAVAALGDELVRRDGHDGLVYLDVPDAPAPREVEGVLLIPEFDALFCGYHPAGRGRFATPEHHARLWTRANGLMRAPLLVDGRITGYWRMTGSARRRPVQVRWFRRTRRPRKAEIEHALDGVEAALDITVGSLTIGCE